MVQEVLWGELQKLKHDFLFEFDQKSALDIPALLLISEHIEIFTKEKEWGSEISELGTQNRRIEISEPSQPSWPGFSISEKTWVREPNSFGAKKAKIAATNGVALTTLLTIHN